jgi:hypothetical protein
MFTWTKFYKNGIRKHTLGGGGRERVCVCMCSTWKVCKNLTFYDQVILATSEDELKNVVQKLYKTVQRYDLKYLI